jgi:hypothetical protein
MGSLGLLGVGRVTPAETPTYVRGNFQQGGGASSSSYSSNDATNLLVVGVWSGSGTFSISDTAGNTYVSIGSVTDGAGHKAELFYVASCVASAGTNTLTFSGGSGYTRIALVEYSGVAAVSPLRTSATATGSGTSADTGNMTVVVGDLILGWIEGEWNNDNFSTGSGYTKRQGTGKEGIIEKIADSTTEHPNATGSAGDQWTAIGAAFKPGP